MPEINMKFDLPEEREEYDMALHGADFHSVIWEVLQEMRSTIKHGDDAVAAEFAESWRGRMWEWINHYCVGSHF